MCKNVRIRRKPWARPELAACDFFIDDPPKYKGTWQELFGNKNPMHLELGCGKGVFIAKVGTVNQQINYVAIDLKSEVLALARRRIVQEYGDEEIKTVSNVKLM